VEAEAADLALAMQPARCVAEAAAGVVLGSQSFSLALMRLARLKPWSSGLGEQAELPERLTRQTEPLELLVAKAPSSASGHPEETLAMLEQMRQAVMVAQRARQWPLAS